MPSELNIFLIFLLLFCMLIFSRSCLIYAYVHALFFLLTSRGGKERMCSERGRSAVVAVTPSGRRVAYALLVPQISARNFTSRLERAHGNAICLDGGLLVPWQDCREIVFSSGEERATTPPIWRYCRAGTGKRVGSPTQEAPSGREMSRRVLCKSLRQAWRGGRAGKWAWAPMAAVERAQFPGSGVEERANKISCMPNEGKEAGTMQENGHQKW